MKRQPIIALFAAAVLGAAASVSMAQDTPGITAPESMKGTIRKNRAPVASHVLKVHFPKPKAYTLENGLKVYILEDRRVPGASFSVILNAGSLYADKPEVAEATGAQLDDGTTTRTANDISRLVDGMGAELNSGAGTEYANISIAGLSDFTEPMLDILADVILNPVFPQDRLDEYKYRRIAGLPARKADADSLARLLLTRVNYGETPYARMAPVKAEVEAVTREDLIAWHKRAYVPNGARLTVVGDVDADALMVRIRALFGDWKPAVKPAELPPANFKPYEKTAVHLIDRPDSQQTILRFTNIAIPRNHPDYVPLVVANRILGGGSTGRLFQNIREEKGYTYGAYSNISTPRWAGTWGASASVRTEVTGPAVKEFVYEFHRLQNEPVSDEELARVKRTIIGSFARTLQSPDNIMAKAIEIVRNGLPADYWETYPAKVQAVTAADVQRVARKYLGQNRIQIVAVGRRAAIEPVLTQYGPVLVYNDDVQPLGASAVPRPAQGGE